MNRFTGIKRYSGSFALLFVLLSLAFVLGFMVSSERKISFEDCRALGLPVLEINTSKNKEILSKEDYVKGNFTLTEGKSEKNQEIVRVVSGECKVRGHGNSTWKTTFTQKKPYLLKLEESQALLGMGSAQKWVLLANACDRSMLRNFYAEYLTHNVWNKMDWNPRSEFVTLFINGKYRGLYSLSEKVEVEKNRLEFEGEGFLAEIDSHSGRPYSFLSPTGLRFHIRSPKSTQEDYEKWAAKIIELENRLFSSEFEEKGSYRQYLDVDSFVDWYLLAEFSKNYDSKFYNSVFMHYDYKKQKLFMGPSWDHDIAFGNSGESSTGVSSMDSMVSNSAWLWMFKFFDFSKNSTMPADHEGFLINQNAWYHRLFNDYDFLAAVVKRWNETREDLKASIDWLREQGRRLEAAGEMNDSVWHLLGSAIWPRAPGYRQRKTYQSEVEYLADWCERRFEWMDGIFHH